MLPYVNAFHTLLVSLVKAVYFLFAVLNFEVLVSVLTSLIKFTANFKMSHTCG